MRALIDLIIHNKHWFVFLLLEVISLVFLFSYNGYQKSVYFTTANDVVGSAYNVISGITSYLHLQEENHELETANEQLRKEVLEMRQQLAIMGQDSIKRLPELPLQYNVLSAQVVNMTLHKANNLITINKGEADGVPPEMGVICSKGVVGIVYMTGPNYSLVLPVNNRKSSISCRVRGQRYFGYLQWDGHNTRRAYVDDIPRYAKIKAGEIVETSGYSAVFPPGMFVGKVRKVRNSADGQSYRLDIDLNIDLSTVRDVYIITTPYKSEIDTLRKRADEAFGTP